MVNFDYQTPTRLIFGKGVVAEKLQRVMAQFGQRVLLTYGGGSIKRSGLYQQVKDLLADKQIFERPGIEPNPKFNPSVLDGVRICKEQASQRVKARATALAEERIVDIIRNYALAHQKQ